MASTAERLRKLVSDNIEVDGKAIDLPDDLNISLPEMGVSSTDIVALAKLVANEFNITLTPEDCVATDGLKNLAELIDRKAA